MDFLRCDCVDGLCKWLGTDDHAGQQSDLVFYTLFADAGYSIPTFLLAAPRSAHPVDI